MLSLLPEGRKRRVSSRRDAASREVGQGPGPAPETFLHFLHVAYRGLRRPGLWIPKGLCTLEAKEPQADAMRRWPQTAPGTGRLLRARAGSEGGGSAHAPRSHPAHGFFRLHHFLCPLPPAWSPLTRLTVLKSFPTNVSGRRAGRALDQPQNLSAPVPPTGGSIIP